MIPFSKKGPCLTDEELAAYLAGGGDRDRAEEHLASCEACLDTTLAAHSAAPAEVSERTVKRVESLVPRRAARPASPAWGWGVAGLAAAFFIAVFVWVYSQSAPSARKDKVAQPRKEEPKRESADPPKKETPKPEEKKEEKLVEEKKPDEKKPDEKKEEKVVKDPKPEEKKPEEKKPEKTEEKPALVTLDRVDGEVWLGERRAKKGDRVAPDSRLRTGFGEHALVEAGGSAFLLHQQSEIALGSAARVGAGRVFVKSAPNLVVETPAGTITPAGTEFAVEIQGDQTWVAVKDGSVHFQNTRGKTKVEKGQLVRCTTGQAPKRPERLADPDAYFDWTEKGVAKRYVMLYPGAKKTGAVITAPHAPFEIVTATMAAHIAERLNVSCVVGYGYAEKANTSIVNVPGEGSEKAVFEEYVKCVREGTAVWPARLIVELHGHAEKDEPPVIEIATAGFSKDEVARMKELFLAVLKRHKPDVEARVIFDLTDGDLRFGAAEMRKRGIFQEKVTQHGLKIEMPRACREPSKVREQYEAILAEWIEALK